MIIVFVVPSIKNIGPTNQLLILIEGLLNKYACVHVVTFTRHASDNELLPHFPKLGVIVYEFKRSKLSLLKNIFNLWQL